ncbi:hypothetical protein U1Q18_005060 [Sarracenia purpurea var. burkii]
MPHGTAGRNSVATEPTFVQWRISDYPLPRLASPVTSYRRNGLRHGFVLKPLLLQSLSLPRLYLICRIHRRALILM